MKRLFVVFVIVMMLFVVGCQSVPLVDTNVIESDKSIFFMSDENITNAGIVRDENGKYSWNGSDGEEGSGINEAAVNDPGQPMIRLTDDTPINTNDVTAEDSHDKRDVTDTADGNNGKEASMQPEQNTTDSEKDDILILMIPHNNEKDAASDTQPQSLKAYSSQESTTDVPSNNENKTDDTSDIQPAPKEEQSPQEPTIDVPSNNENETDDPSDTQPAPKEDQSPQKPTIDVPYNNQNEADDPSNTQFPPQEENSPQEPAADVPSNNEPSPNEADFQIQIDSNNTLISYKGTAAHVDLTNEKILSVGCNVFKDNGYIETVQLPDSVTDIGESAFEGCSNLTTLQLPRSVQTIRDYAFKDTGLSGCISFYAANVSIGSNAFENTHIEKIVLDPCIKTELTLGSYAFANCSYLNHIEMLNKQSSLILADNAFYQVNDLNIYLGNPANRTIYYPKQYSKENLGLAGTLSFLDPKNLPNP